MDHGTLTDSKGKSADFKNVILVMTTNLGAGASISQKGPLGFTQQVEEVSHENQEIIRSFTPEFRNRLTDIINFNSLTPEMMPKIVDKVFDELRQRVGNKGLSLEVTPGALSLIAEEGFDPQMGARPLKRLIAKKVQTPIARKILKEGLSDLDKGTIVVDINNGGSLSITFQGSASANDNNPSVENVKASVVREKLELGG